jgi:hypothetical protein
MNLDDNLFIGWNAYMDHLLNDPYNDNVTYAYCSLCILKE